MNQGQPDPRLRLGLGAAVLALVIGAFFLSAPVRAGTTLERVKASGTLRMCIWPEYYGVAFRNPKSKAISGLDIELSAELARTLGARLSYVESSFASLADDLLRDKCDLSLQAVLMPAERQQGLRFSQPYLRSDIYGITTKSNRSVRRWDDIDQPGVVVAVQADSLMEPIMQKALRSAKLLVVRPPQTREQELESGRADVFMADYPYSRRLLEQADWARLVAPTRAFNPISYAYAVKPGDDEWLRTLDGFVAAIKRDGRLEASARRYGLGDVVGR